MQNTKLEKDEPEAQTQMRNMQVGSSAAKKEPGVIMDQKIKMRQQYEALCETGDNYSTLAHAGKASARPLWLN